MQSFYGTEGDLERREADTTGDGHFDTINHCEEGREGEHIAHLDKAIGTSEPMLRAMPEES